MFLKSINISKLLWEHQLNALTVKITGARTYGVPDQQNPDSRWGGFPTLNFIRKSAPRNNKEDALIPHRKSLLALIKCL